MNELYGELEWAFDLQTGVLTFDERFSFEAQVLGTESDVTNTWLWAWANRNSGIGDSLLQAARQLRQFGEMHHISALVEEQCELGAVSGHYLAMIASAVCEASAYYRGPYEGGAVFLLIADNRLAKNPVNPVNRARTVFVESISQLPITNHKRAFQAYLDYLRLTYNLENSIVHVTSNGTIVLQAKFDNSDRLVSLTASS